MSIKYNIKEMRVEISDKHILIGWNYATIQDANLIMSLYYNDLLSKGLKPKIELI